MNLDDVSTWSDRQIENVINGVYSGVYSPSRLPVELYNETTKRLTSGVLSAFGESDLTAGSPDLDLLNHFKYNVAIFSGAKTHQQVVDMSAEIFKDGTKQSFSDFKETAGKIFETYNVNWLKTEFNMANNQALSGVKWNDIQKTKQIFPLLRYMTTGDDRVRDEHVILDGIVRPVDDPFWSTYYPQNDWGCRCTVEQIADGEADETNPDELKSIESEYQPGKLFDGNVGKDKMIFAPEHPYFKVSDRYQLLKTTNFNLPTPPKPVTVEPLVAEYTVQQKEFAKKFKIDPEILSASGWKNIPLDLSFKNGAEISKYLRQQQKHFFYSPTTNAVYMNERTDRWKRSKVWQQMVSTHEIGHSVHRNIRAVTEDFISPRTEKFKNDLIDSINKQFGHIENKTKYFSFNGYTGSIRSEISDYLKTVGVDRVSDRSEIASVLLDTIGGITKGDFGGGHDISYYRATNGGMKEVFANMFQVTQQKDDFSRKMFEKFWPEGLKIATEYFNDVLK